MNAIGLLHLTAEQFYAGVHLEQWGAESTDTHTQIHTCRAWQEGFHLESHCCPWHLCEPAISDFSCFLLLSFLFLGMVQCCLLHCLLSSTLSASFFFFFTLPLSLSSLPPTFLLSQHLVLFYSCETLYSLSCFDLT